MTRPLILTPAAIARFRSRLLAAPSGCLEWQGATATQMRYGAMSIGGRVEYTHRIAWTLAYGPIPDGRCVLHTCDNPRCCLPAHLFLGTRTTNSDDKVAKGRQPKGAAIHWARLTESDVAEILTAHATGLFTTRDLAREYGVVDGTIRAIVTGRSWAHVAGPRERAMGVTATVARAA